MIRYLTIKIFERKITLFSIFLTAIGIMGCERRIEYVPPPPPAVTVSHPIKQSVTHFAEFTGTTEAVESVEIRARVEGYLQSIHFIPGERIKKNDLLFVVDPKPFQAKLNEVEAELLIRQAELRLAQATLQRKEGAFKETAVSEVEVIQARAEREKAVAAIEAALASIQTARLNLSYTEIRSPINGRVGRNLVDVGNLVGADERTLLTHIVKDAPIFAYFFISEHDLMDYRRKYQEKKIPTDGQGRAFAYLGLTDETGYPHEGRIDYFDIRVDSSTGTIQVRGVFPNSNNLLLPGLFVRIRVPVGTQYDAWVVPDSALGADQQGRFLLLVDDKNMIEYRPVKIGAKVDEMRVIESGISPDDRVIIKGIQRARPGATVNPVEAETQATDETGSLGIIKDRGNDYV